MAEASIDPEAGGIPDPDGRLAPLLLLTISLVLGISTWFSATAVVPQIVGIAAMLRLKQLPEASLIAGGRG